MFSWNTFRASLAACLVVLGCTSGSASAVTILDTTELAAATPELAAAVPAARSFQIGTAGSYEVSVKDLGIPRELDGLRAAVVRDGAIVAQISGPGTRLFSAEPGTYTVHVVGQPMSGAAGGSFSVQVSAVDSGAVVFGLADVIGAQPVLAPNQVAVIEQVTIPGAGSYQLTLTDHQFPSPLASLQSLLIRESDSTPVLTNAGSFAAAPGEYLLFAVAEAATEGGLFSIRLQREDASAPAYAQSFPAGKMRAWTSTELESEGPHRLEVQDAQFPADMSALHAAVAQGGELKGTRAGTGSLSFAGSEGPLTVFGAGTPDAGAGVGTVLVRVIEGAAQIRHSAVVPVRSASDATSPAIFVYTESAAAGDYRLRLKDFGFPARFQSLRAALVIAGQLSAAGLNAEGSLDFSHPGGSVDVLVAGTPAGSAGNSLFGVAVRPAASGAAVLEAAQGLGGLFRSQEIAIAEPGTYDIELDDVGFPAAMRDPSLAITRGTDLVVQLYGGSATRRELQAGNYLVSFQGKPGEDQQYGTYAIKIESSPLPPTVTLTANPTSVVSGNTTTLTWSSENSTACTAEGSATGWSGTKPESGSHTTAALTANTTYTMSCSGPGGSGSASVSVTVTQPATGGGGGGGAMGGAFLAWLLSLVSLRARGRFRDS